MIIKLMIARENIGQVLGDTEGYHSVHLTQWTGFVT